MKSIPSALLFILIFFLPSASSICQEQKPIIHAGQDYCIVADNQGEFQVFTESGDDEDLHWINQAKEAFIAHTGIKDVQWLDFGYVENNGVGNLFLLTKEGRFYHLEHFLIGTMLFELEGVYKSMSTNKRVAVLKNAEGGLEVYHPKSGDEGEDWRPLDYLETDPLNLSQQPALNSDVGDFEVGYFAGVAAKRGSLITWGKKGNKIVQHMPLLNEKVERVAIGQGMNAIVLDARGDVFVWGMGDGVPEQVRQSTNIKDVYSGDQTVGVLTHDGLFHSWRPDNPERSHEVISGVVDLDMGLIAGRAVWGNQSGEIHWGTYAPQKLEMESVSWVRDEEAILGGRPVESPQGTRPILNDEDSEIRFPIRTQNNFLDFFTTPQTKSFLLDQSQRLAQFDIDETLGCPPTIPIRNRDLRLSSCLAERIRVLNRVNSVLGQAGIEHLSIKNQINVRHKDLSRLPPQMIKAISRSNPVLPANSRERSELIDAYLYDALQADEKELTLHKDPFTGVSTVKTGFTPFYRGDQKLNVFSSLMTHLTFYKFSIDHFRNTWGQAAGMDLIAPVEYVEEAFFGQGEGTYGFLQFRGSYNAWDEDFERTVRLYGAESLTQRHFDQINDFQEALEKRQITITVALQDGTLLKGLAFLQEEEDLSFSIGLPVDLEDLCELAESSIAGMKLETTDGQLLRQWEPNYWGKFQYEWEALHNSRVMLDEIGDLYAFKAPIDFWSLQSDIGLELEKTQFTVGGVDVRQMDMYQLDKLVEVFLADCRDHSIYIQHPQYVRATFEPLEGELIALAFKMNVDDEIEIKVDPENWSRSSLAKKWYILYHELGHDVLNLEHGQGGKMMFNFANKEYRWEEFLADKEKMFGYALD